MELRRKPFDPLELKDWMGLFIMSIYQNPSDFVSFQQLVPLAISSEKNKKRLAKQQIQTENISRKLEQIKNSL
jgi:hypothetical protein